MRGWILGNHRLLCGDAGKAEDVDRLLDGATIHLVNTDPPYNVGVASRSNNAIAAGEELAEKAKQEEALEAVEGKGQRSLTTRVTGCCQGPAG